MQTLAKGEAIVIKSKNKTPVAFANEKQMLWVIKSRIKTPLTL